MTVADQGVRADAPAPRTNGLSIAALVAGLVPLCGLGSIAGIALGWLGVATTVDDRVLTEC